jgi:hypothetical protein
MARVVQDACSYVGFNGGIFHVVRRGETVGTFSDLRVARRYADLINKGIE